MSARIRWVRGGESQIVSVSATSIVLRSTVPAPPGSRLEGTVEADGRELPLRIKVHASKRVTEGEFVLHGRALDLTREVRQCLEALAVSSTSSHGTP